MYDDCIPFEYGRKDGTRLSEEEFFSEHQDIILTSVQKERLIQNLELQCILALREFGNRDQIILKGFRKSFIYRDDETQELFLRPLEVHIKVFFKKITPILLIYDMRVS